VKPPAESVVAALASSGPGACRIALARKLAALVDDPDVPSYAVASIARTLSGLLDALGEQDAQEAQATRILREVV
jgi:hypothetical protein